MANADNPRGFVPTRHLKGGEIRSRQYVMTPSAAAIYPGDVLKWVATGTVELAAAADGAICIGVAAEYHAAAAATGTTYIQVYDDPDIVYQVQIRTGDTPVAADVFTVGDHLATGGDSTLKMSRQELKLDGNAQFLILGLVRDENNAWGEHADVEVIFGEHALRTRAGV
jgi:hypothetical protein